MPTSSSGIFLHILYRVIATMPNTARPPEKHTFKQDNTKWQQSKENVVATILLNDISAHCQALIPRKIISYNEFLDGAEGYFCLSENLAHWCFKKMDYFGASPSQIYMCIPQIIVSAI